MENCGVNASRVALFPTHGVTAAYIYTIILLKSVCLSTFADCRSQFLLDRLERCLKLFVSSGSTSCHEFASQFGLAFFLYAKNIHKLSRMPSLAHMAVEWTSHTDNNAVTVESLATRRSRNNCGHTAKNQRVKTATVRVYTVTA